MNKLFSKIATLSVGLAMAVGVGVALGHEGVREVRADDGTWTLAGPSTNGTVVDENYSTGVGGIKFTGAQGGNGTATNVPKWYSSGNEIRVYASNDITFSITDGTITAISFTYSGDGYKNLASVNTGTLSNGAWSGSASSVTFRNGSSQTRFTAVQFTYSGGSVDPDPDPSTHGKTAEDPLTVAEAKALIDANVPSSEYYYVKGKYVKTTTNTSKLSQYKNADLWFSDTGADSNTIEAYRCKYLNNTNLDSVDKLPAVGQEMTVYGTLTKYNSTYELAQGCYIYSLGETPAPLDTVTTIPEVYTATVGSPVSIDGYFVGQVSDGIYIMNGAYGMFIYQASLPSGEITLNETVLHIEGVSATFHNLYQVKDATITIAGTASTPINYTITGSESSADLSVASRRIVEKGVITKITRDGTDYLPTYEGDVPTVDANKDIFLTLGESLQVIFKKTDVTQAKFEALFDCLLNGKKVNLEAFTGFFDSTFQLRYSSVVEATEGYTAEKFAEDLMSKTDEVCYGYDGVTDNTEALAAKWLELQANVLSDEEVARFNDEDNDFAEERARYDYLVGKYGLTDFLLRNPAPIGGSNYNFAETSDNSYVIIVVISAVSVMSFGLALFLRKKRSK